MRAVLITFGALVVALCLTGAGNQAAPQKAPTLAASHTVVQQPASLPEPGKEPEPSAVPATRARSAAASLSAAGQTALVKQYCVGCHNDRMKTGGLTLASFDATTITDHAAIGEKMIRKLRAGMMPPPGAKRPERPALIALAAALERRIDEAAAAVPNPGWRPSQRLSRAEYARAVKDLVGLDIDVGAFLPPETLSESFDNIADTQMTSPALLQGYLRAASEISRLAVGDRSVSPSSKTWKVPRTASQMRHVEGAPLGTRGGLSVVHVFPADGEYVFKTMLHMDPTGDLYGAPQVGEQLEISIDGSRAALMDVDPSMTEEGKGVTMTSAPIHVTAGPHRLSAAFLSRFEGPVQDLIRPVEQTLADTNIGSAFGVTTLPHVRDFTVTGPMKVTGVSDTPSRRAIFTCRPTTPDEEAPCASAIIRRLGSLAYRGLLTAEDFDELIGFYETGRRDGDFEHGIRFALQAMLASPRFLLRLEPTPATLSEGQTYRLSDVALASRLSFFLWGTLPDDKLMDLARRRTLSNPSVYEKQVRRMLTDRRSEALASRFAYQWLRLKGVEEVSPDHHLFPLWDATLSEAMVRETELFFESLIHEDRSVLDLLTADYTFVNERLAKHYRIPNVLGTAFRRVQLPDEHRRGILGHGSVLTLTSFADRTSPVLRGKWVMEVLLGSPPPPPPPNVPLLEETAAAVGGKTLSVRERMEEHRRNPACNSCHRVIDPLGLALENFDATGAWRIKDNGNAIDPVGDLYDGTTLAGPGDLRDALLKYQDLIVLSFTESLMTYALGRRVEFYDMPTVRAIVRDAKQNDYRFSSFILGIAKSPAFRMSKAAPAETSASGPGASRDRQSQNGR